MKKELNLFKTNLTITKGILQFMQVYLFEVFGTNSSRNPMYCNRALLSAA